MPYEIRYLPLAMEDIDRLAGYLSRFYPATAARVLGQMEEKIAHLPDNPNLYEEYKENPFYRRLVTGDYLVFYHVNEEQHLIDIFRVLRGSWNLSERLHDK